MHEKRYRGERGQRGKGTNCILEKLKPSIPASLEVQKTLTEKHIAFLINQMTKKTWSTVVPYNCCAVQYLCLDMMVVRERLLLLFCFVFSSPFNTISNELQTTAGLVLPTWPRPDDWWAMRGKTEGINTNPCVIKSEKCHCHYSLCECITNKLYVNVSRSQLSKGHKKSKGTVSYSPQVRRSHLPSSSDQRWHISTALLRRNQ